MDRIRRRSMGGLLVALLLSVLIGPPAASQTAVPGERLDLDAFAARQVVPGELIVSYRQGSTLPSRLAARSFVRSAARLGGRTALLRLTRGTSTASAIRALRADPNVAWVEPNVRRYTQQVLPNDPNFDQQWALLNSGQAHVVSGSLQTTSGTPGADMSVTDAWNTTRGSDETVVAILDSGVDVTHPDLAANIWTNDGEIAGNGIDDDRNGHIDDVNGWDFAENDSSLFESNTSYFGFDHGTHVAGTVAAEADNNIGVAGVCPDCKIMVLKVFEPADTDMPADGIKDTMVGDVAVGIDAIEYAIEMGADVINGSFGAPLLWSRAERNVIKRAISSGITPVFAAGNERGDNDLLVVMDFDGDQVPDALSPSYPASYNLPGLISVGASNDRDRNGYSTACALQRGVQDWRCSFTNYGRESVDLVAPGVDIISSVPGGYATFDGTSMAAPHVAGAVGLIRSAHPTYTPAQIRNALINSVDKPAELTSLFSFPGRTARGTFTVSGGRANVAAALTASTANLQPPTDGTISGARRVRRSVRGSVQWPADSNDVFKKRLRRGARYKVVLDGPFGADFDLVLYKPSVTEIWQLEMGCFLVGAGGCKLLEYAPETDADESYTFKARRTGTHYFQVAAFLFQRGNYTLRVRKL